MANAIENHSPRVHCITVVNKPVSDYAIKSALLLSQYDITESSVAPHIGRNGGAGAIGKTRFDAPHHNKASAIRGG